MFLFAPRRVERNNRFLQVKFPGNQYPLTICPDAVQRTIKSLESGLIRKLWSMFLVRLPLTYQLINKASEEPHR